MRGVAVPDRISIADGVARVTYSGPIDFDVWVELVDRMLAHDEYRPGMPCLWDTREATAGAIHRHDLERMGTHLREHADRLAASKIAVVAIGDLEFGLGRMYEQLNALDAPIRFRVFRKLEEAEAWLAT